ncbi:hypothetical protein HYW58_02835 [Candidatus Kaiserbacteria bacterium]|nr:hypothetical protein [Candidatus Kaiserbacteria bacterium]
MIKVERSFPYIIATFALVLVIGFVFFQTSFAHEMKTRFSLTECRSVTNGQEQIDCINRIIEEEIIRGDIADGMRVFKSAYSMFPPFANDCHNQAHRIGDFIYYKIYLNDKDISKIHFPSETNGCKLGVFHGFFEHLFQDNPNPLFVTEICENFKQSPIEGVNPAVMGYTCYNGSGHGFQLAFAAEVPEAMWGNPKALVQKPLQYCERLRYINEHVTETDKETCIEGIFSYIISWMKSGEYGLSYDNKDPFSLCHTLNQDRRSSCYRGMLPGPTSTPAVSPEVITRLLEPIGDKDVRLWLFEVSISNNVSNTVGAKINTDGKNWYKETLAECEPFDAELYNRCMSGIVRGILAHVKPEEEYSSVRMLCEEPTVVQRGAEDKCRQSVQYWMDYLYTPQEVLSIKEKA